MNDGVPLAGGPSDAFTRERASATPSARGPHGHVHSSAEASSVVDEPTLVTGRVPGGGSQKPALPVSLAPLQQWFAAVMTHPQGVAEGIAAERAKGTLPVDVADVETVVRPSSRLSGVERIAIYHDAYRARLVECLIDDYPAVQHGLTAEDFEALCYRYIERHPSTSPSLNFFGRHFSAFCKEWDDPRRDFAAQLAMLEWAMVEVLHAAPAENLSPEELAKVPLTAWESARFTPSDTVRVFPFSYPVNAYYQAFRHDQEPELPAPSETATAIFRDGATLWRMDLSPPMYRLLRSLFDGTPLGAALTALVESGQINESQAPEVMVWFRDWVKHGLFGSILVA